MEPLAPVLYLCIHDYFLITKNEPAGSASSCLALYFLSSEDFGTRLFQDMIEHAKV
jgi:hypothetical protein